jgi:predicted CopG family antitoxin
MQKSQNLQQNNIKHKRQPHISLSHENYEKLKNLGTCGDSFNDVLTKILSKQEGV